MSLFKTNTTKIKSKIIIIKKKKSEDNITKDIRNYFKLKRDNKAIKDIKEPFRSIFSRCQTGLEEWKLVVLSLILLIFYFKNVVKEIWNVLD